MNDEIPTLYDGPHTSIVGATGSGKSTLGMALFDSAPGTAIFVDPSGAEMSDSRADYVIDLSEGDALEPEAFAEYRRIRIVPPDGTGTEDDIRAMEGLQRLLFDIGENIPHENGKFYVFIDEAHEVAPLSASGDNPVVRLAKRGRSHNVRLFLISQSPADMSKKAVKQVHYHVVFALNDYSLDYLKRYGMPSEAVEGAVGAPGSYKFVVYDGYDLSGPYRLDSAYVR